MEEKAGKIEQKLTKIEGDALEETKLSRDISFSHNLQLVPVNENLGYIPSASTAVSFNNVP